MNKFIYTSLILCVLITVSACRKYVEIEPLNSRILKLTADYLQLMQNTTKFDNAYYSPIFAGDDVGTNDIRWQNSLAEPARNAYTWASNIYVSNEDLDWSTMYAQILICNTVISGVMKSEGGTDAEKHKAMAYALVQRAFNYYTLVNMYSKQYDPGTASIDLGVPLVLEPKFFTDLTRPSIQKVYDQIIADLNTALPSLNSLPDFNANPSKAAVYSLLARTYLNMRNFTEAGKNANLALGLQNTLLDLKNYIDVLTSIPARNLNDEEIFFKKTNNFPVTYPLSVDAVNMYNVKDLRFELFTRDGAIMSGSNFTTRAYYRYKILSDGNYVGTSVPEMMLIKAECAARDNNAGSAVTILNALRVKRFRPADYVALQATDPNVALHLVIDERKREFAGRGFRWFDQRRLSKDNGFVNTVTRVFKDVTYTIEPGANRYTYPIADKYILLNPEITPNP